MNIKCIVAGTNANGEPDLYFCIVNCTIDQGHNGNHYDTAKEMAEDNGYEGPFVAFDERDSAGHAMLDLFEWSTASTGITLISN